MRILVTFLLLLVSISCARKVEDLKAVPNNQIIISSGISNTSELNKITTPDLFEKSPPTSSILRSSLIMFEDGYERIFSDDGVIDIATDDRVIAILKQQFVMLNITECSSLLTDDNYQQITLYKNFLVLANRNKVAVYSISDCARVAVYQRSAYGGIAIVDNFFIEYQASSVLLRNLFNGSLILSVNMDIPIVGVLKLKDKISLIHNNGYITHYDKKVNSFILDDAIGIPFTEIKVSGNYIYGKSNDGEFFTISDMGEYLSNYFNCKLSNLSPTAKCGGALIYDDKRYSGISETNGNFLAGNGLYMELEKGVMNIFSLTRGYQRYIAFNYTLPKPCLTQKGALFFTTFAGDNVTVQNGIEKLVKNIPNKCNYSQAKILGGNILCNSKRCYQFAKEVYKDDNGKVFRREERGKIYFYFENR